MSNDCSSRATPQSPEFPRLDSSPAPSLKRQFAWSMMPIAAVTLLNLVSVRLFYRYLGPELYAIWFDVNVLTGAFGFVDMGIGTAVGRYIGIAIGAGDKKAVCEYWGTGNAMALPILAIMSVVFMIVGICFGPRWYQVSAENVRLLEWAFFSGGFALFLSYYTTFWLILSQAHFDFKFIGTLRSVLAVIQVSTAIGLAYLTRNPVILIWANVFFWVVQLGFFIWHARRRYKLGFSIAHSTLARAREMLAMSGKVFAMVLIDAFGSNSDRLLLGRVALPAPFTHYNICYNFGARILQMGGTIIGPVFHQTSRAIGKGTHQTAGAIYNETFDFTFGFYALAAVWTVCWHPVLLRLWLGADLAPKVTPAFTPLVIAFCLSGIAMISAGQLVPLNRAGAQIGFAAANSICLGSFALSGWFLGGLAGVAWGVLASRIVLVAQDLYVIRLVGGGGWLAFRTWRQLLAQCAAGGIFFLIRPLLPESIYWGIAPAAMHGALVSAWLLRHQIRRYVSFLRWHLSRQG